MTLLLRLNQKRIHLRYASLPFLLSGVSVAIVIALLVSSTYNGENAINTLTEFTSHATPQEAVALYPSASIDNALASDLYSPYVPMKTVLYHLQTRDEWRLSKLLDENRDGYVDGSTISVGEFLERVKLNLARSR